VGGENRCPDLDQIDTSDEIQDNQDVDLDNSASSACDRPTTPSQGGPRRIERWRDSLF